MTDGDIFIPKLYWEVTNVLIGNLVSTFVTIKYFSLKWVLLSHSYEVVVFSEGHVMMLLQRPHHINNVSLVVQCLYSHSEFCCLYFWHLCHSTLCLGISIAGMKDWPKQHGRKEGFGLRFHRSLSPRKSGQGKILEAGACCRGQEGYRLLACSAASL